MISRVLKHLEPAKVIQARESVLPQIPKFFGISERSGSARQVRFRTKKRMGTEQRFLMKWKREAILPKGAF